MEECIFCKIIAGEIPAEKLYEDEDILAFLDIMPINPGHTLVVSKKHFKNILDLPEKEWLSVAKAVRLLAPKVKEAVGADGVNITMNNELAANQVVFHAHVHVIPRLHGDPHRPWTGTPYKEGEAGKVGAKIREIS